MIRLVQGPAEVVGALREIPKGALGDELSETLKEKLTISNATWWKAKKGGYQPKGDPELIMYRETETSLFVPRHAPFETGFKKVDRRRVRAGGYVEPVEHSMELWNDTQERSVKALLKDDSDKILSLACGRGKTAVSLYAASEGERFPLLIVVHTNALKDQWVANHDETGRLIGGIKKFYGLGEEEVGIIQAGTERWRGYKVAVAMLHTLCLHKFPPEFYNYWRLIIFDECHHLSAELFGKACSLFPCERWGLSATVNRPDGMEQAFLWHLGKVAFKDLEQDLTPRMIFVQTGIVFSMAGLIVPWTGRVNLAKLQTQIAEHQERNRRILMTRLKSLVKEKRIILVLGERLTQLWEMHEAAKGMGWDSAVHVGSMSAEERKRALTKQVVFATQHLAKEGLDRPAFDTLVCLMPFGGAGRLQQSGGRILRFKDGKKQPLIYVFVDNISFMLHLARKMERAARQMDWKIVWEEMA